MSRALHVAFFATHSAANTPIPAFTEIPWFFAYARPAASRISDAFFPSSHASAASCRMNAPGYINWVVVSSGSAPTRRSDSEKYDWLMQHNTITGFGLAGG